MSIHVKMKPGNHIYDELASISPFLASLERINPYKVPENYFEQASIGILNQSLSDTYKGMAKIALPTMEVPAGYFENLAGSILSKINAESKEELGVLDEIGRKNVFAVPTGYFEILPGEVMAGIATANLENVAGKTNVFSIPEGYFETLNDEVSAERATVELRKMTGQSNVFSVPSGYFENLTGEILNKVTGERPAAKVVQMHPRRFSLPKLAVAASIATVMAVSAWFKLNNSDANSIDQSTLADAKEILQSNSFDKVLNSLTDEEITGYLEEKGQNVNAALVAAAAANDTDLPAEEDYIFDENTLNEFLKENAVIN